MFAATEIIPYTGETGAGAVVAPASTSTLRPTATAGALPVDAIPVLSLVAPAPMLNIDRSFLPTPAATMAPAQPIQPATPAASSLLPSEADAYTWLRAHWWLVAALLVLLVLAYVAARRQPAGSSRARHARGSDEAREHMARLRSMKKGS